jgi:FAD/FMN-containing dehydrogenase
MTTPKLFLERFPGHCADDADRLRIYEIPERGAPGKASCVLLPDSEAELQDMLRTANVLKLPLVISAGRTGLVEAQRPDGEAVLSLERLNRPLRFELADGRGYDFIAAHKPEDAATALGHWWRALGQPVLEGATLDVQAGIPVDSVNLILDAVGLVWPMEMGSSSAASIGGCIANASAGANAVQYGTAAHLCAEAWGFWGSGEPAGPCQAEAWGDHDPQRLAINSAQPNPAWGLIGTQGVLGIVTRARLRLWPRPVQREAVLLPLPDMPAAMRLLLAAQQSFPQAVEEFEFIARGAMSLVCNYLGDAWRSPFEGPQDAPYFALLQVKSHHPDEDLAGRLYGFLADTLSWPAESIGYAPLPALKKLRHSITEASNARFRAQGGGRLSFDTATPVDQFGDYLDALAAEVSAAAPGYELIAFGHAGVGGAHLHVLGTREQPVTAQADAIVKLVFDVTARFGGTFSAEHGVGPKWASEFQHRVPSAISAALAAAKHQRDPNWVLNPRSFGLH